MSAIATELTLADLAPMMRAALKDKRYRASSLGALVGRYCRWFRNEKGASSESLRDYESVLSKMALTLADKEPADVTIEDLRDVIDLWSMREGVSIIVATYNGELDDPALIKKLAKYPGGGAGVLGDAKGLRRIRKASVPRCVAETIVEAYNSGRRANRLPLP